MVGEIQIKTKHSHYFKDVSKLSFIDVYRVCQLFNVTDPCLQHAIKKLLLPGHRGGRKTEQQDVQEAIDTLKRYMEMQEENSAVNITTKLNPQIWDPVDNKHPNRINETSLGKQDIKIETEQVKENQSGVIAAPPLTYGQTQNEKTT